MPLENVPAGQPADGRGLVLLVETIAGSAGPTVAEASAVSTVALTYSLTGDGFRHETTENTISTSRYTLKQQLELAGTVTDSLELQYVTGSPADVALVEGTEGYIVHRLGIANDVAPAAGQAVDVIPFRAGVQRKVAPTANTELMKVSKLFITGPVRRDVSIVATGGGGA